MSWTAIARGTWESADGRWRAVREGGHGGTAVRWRLHQWRAYPGAGRTPWGEWQPVSLHRTLEQAKTKAARADAEQAGAAS